MYSRLITGIFLVAFSAGAAAFDDPMRPPTRQSVPVVAPKPQLQLTSVVIGRERRIAVINGERVTVGSKVAGAQVVSITPARVILRRNGRDAVLSLLDLQVKAISKARKEE